MGLAKPDLPFSTHIIFLNRLHVPFILSLNAEPPHLLQISRYYGQCKIVSLWAFKVHKRNAQAFCKDRTTRGSHSSSGRE